MSNEKKKKANIRARNQKIAAKRGDTWRKKIISSKLKDNATWLARTRVGRGFSQKEMYQASGLGSLNTYSRLERRKGLISRKSASAIASKLNSTFSSLFRKVDANLYEAI